MARMKTGFLHLASLALVAARPKAFAAGRLRAVRQAVVPRVSPALLLGLLLQAQPSAGQLPPASAAVLGTANNYTALARGFASPSLNPAGLGMPGNPAFSLALLPIQGSRTMNPISLSDLSDVGGRLLPSSLKEEWLERIAASGRQDGGASMAVTGFAVNYEFAGLQFSTIAAGKASLNEAAAELLLFGNAGRDGAPRDLSLQGSRMNGFVVSTLGVSAAVPLNIRLVPGFPRQALSLGATLKRSWGNFLAIAEDSGTRTRSDPLDVEVRFPILHTDPASEGSFDRGRGLGLDLGVAWQGGGWSAGAAVQNAFNTFEWDLETMVFRPGEALFNEITRDSDFDERPASQAPGALRQMVADLTFAPVVALGLARETSETLTVTGDFRRGLGDGLEVGPRTHVGAGVEYRPAPSLALRGGVAVVTEGFQGAGGLGVTMGRVHLGLAGLVQRGDAGDGATGMVVLSWGAG
jgi:hypothetical protein